jgi:hypothetical protein
MRKIIFLDIDGVIATPENIENGSWGLVDTKQELLGEILKYTNADIVLSSSWRENDLHNTKMYMDEKGFWYTEKIVGITIRAYQYMNKDQKIHLSIPRGVEIKQWIDANIHSENGTNWNRKVLGSDYQYVILDDDTDMLYEQKDNFINTDSFLGLREGDTKNAIRILNNGNRR